MNLNATDNRSMGDKESTISELEKEKI